MLPLDSFLSFAISFRARRAGVGVCAWRCGLEWISRAGATARPPNVPRKARRRVGRAPTAKTTSRRNRARRDRFVAAVTTSPEWPRESSNSSFFGRARAPRAVARRRRRECGWCRVMWSLAGRSALSSRDAPSLCSRQRRRPCLCTAGRPPSCHPSPPSRAPRGSLSAGGGGWRTTRVSVARARRALPSPNAAERRARARVAGGVSCRALCGAARAAALHVHPPTRKPAAGVERGREALREGVLSGARSGDSCGLTKR